METMIAGQPPPTQVPPGSPPWLYVVAIVPAILGGLTGLLVAFVPAFRSLFTRTPTPAPSTVLEPPIMPVQLEPRRDTSPGFSHEVDISPIALLAVELREINRRLAALQAIAEDGNRVQDDLYEWLDRQITATDGIKERLGKIERELFGRRMQQGGRLR